MKIIIDKINSEPNHSVSKSDIETVIKNVPKEWLGTAIVFRISSQLFSNSSWDRPVISNTPTYIIMSRGYDKLYIIKELLIEIATGPTGIHNRMRAHNINKNDRKQLEEFVQPIYEKVITELTNNHSVNKLLI